jgi:hypothetical protein
MVEQRRAAFEAVSDAGNIDLHHQIVGQVGVQIRPVCLDEGQQSCKFRRYR